MAKLYLKAPGLIYGIGLSEWVFVKKISSNNIQLIANRTNRCKDYLHEAIANGVHKKTISHFCGYSLSESVEINLEKLQLVMGIKNIKPVRSAKRYLNSVERLCGVPLTKLHKCYIPQAKVQDAYYIEADRIYIESPALLHWLVALIRTADLYPDEVIPVKTFEEFLLKQGNIKDTTTLQWCIRNNAAKILMQYHNKYVKPIPLGNIYNKFLTTKDTWGFHSGFGMQAVQHNKIHSPEYKRALNFIGDLAGFTYEEE